MNTPMTMGPMNFGHHVQPIQTSMGGGGRGWILFVRPRTFSNQAPRSLVLAPTTGLVDCLADSAMSVGRLGTYSAIQRVKEHPDARLLATPTMDAFNTVNMMEFQHAWNFYALVENVPIAGSTGNPAVYMGGPLMSSGRSLYFGYTLDEPLSLLTGSPTPNPNAILFITHRTHVRTSSVYGHAGNEMKVDVLGDVDYVVPKHATQTTMINPTIGQGLYVNEPGFLVKHTEIVPGGLPITQMSDAGCVTAATNPIGMNTWHQIPALMTDFITRNVIAVTQQANTERNAPAAFPAMSTATFAFEGVMAGLETKLSHNDPFKGLASPRAEETMTLGQFVQRTGVTVLPPSQGDSAQYYNPVDQRLNSESNRWSSFLAATIPSVMSMFGILSLSFQYDSHHDRMSHGQGFKIQECFPLTPMPNELAVTKAMAACDVLRRDIFSVLTDAQGDFTVTAAVVIGDVSRILLHFWCDTQHTACPFEVPTIMGGLTNPLIANAALTSTSAANMGMMLSHATGGLQQELAQPFTFSSGPDFGVSATGMLPPMLPPLPPMSGV